MPTFIKRLKSVSRRLSLAPKRAFSTVDYWENRYAAGGTSGEGSKGDLAAFKAEVVNGFIRERGIQSVVEFGCGDGQQLELLRCPKYVGLDVSKTAIAMCRRRFGNDPTKTFFLYRPRDPGDHGDRYGADLGVSMDVIYHLIEDDLYYEYLDSLFSAASRFVIIYAFDSDVAPEPLSQHNRPRRFTEDIERRYPGWKLIERIPNRYPYDVPSGKGSWSDFTIYQRQS